MGGRREKRKNMLLVYLVWMEERVGGGFVGGWRMGFEGIFSDN